MERLKILIMIISLALRICECRNSNQLFEEILSTVQNLHSNLEFTNKKIDLLQNDIKILSSERSSSSEMMKNVIEKIDEVKQDILLRVNEIFSKTSHMENADKNQTYEAKHVKQNQAKEVEEKVILVTGGAFRGSTIAVEALNEDGTPLCLLRTNLPNERFLHTMNQNMLCGGGNDLPMASCLQFSYDFDENPWIEFTSYAHEKNMYHVSWFRPDGGIQLIGGRGGWSRAEKPKEEEPTVVVNGSGSKPGFNTKHHTENACAIQLDEFVVITGGQGNGGKFVSKYDMNGWVEDLDELIDARYSHGCGYYYSDSNELVYLVTGGVDPADLEANVLLASTEIMVEGSSWQAVGSLPKACEGLRGISVNNQIFMTGGMGTEHFADDSADSQILKYNVAEKKWVEVGRMHISRFYHALAVLPKAKVEQYCL